MSDLLDVLAIILILIWALAFLGGFYKGSSIHILVVLALIAVLIRLFIRGNAL